MADEITLGIDFGTSNTVAVLSVGRHLQVVRFDGQSFMPSAVFLPDDGVLVVGRDAERPARLAPERFEPNPKRRIDDLELLLGVQVVGVQDAIAAVLHQALVTATAQLGGARPQRVNLTHPAHWGTSRRRMLAEAAGRAGLGAVTMIPEPIAAATHYGTLSSRPLPAGSSLAVYDLGGGTFDCAVVEATETGYLVLAEGGLADVGGVDFDQAILEHLGRGMATVNPQYWQAIAVPQTAADRRASRSLRDDVRSAKESLSRYPQTEVPLPDPFPDALLTRGELDALIRPAIIRTVTQLQRTIRESGRDPDRLTGIYLVGGSSRIPLVAAVIAERTGLVPVTLEEPETAVALGAAMARGVTTNKSAAAAPANTGRGSAHPQPSGAGRQPSRQQATGARPLSGAPADFRAAARTTGLGPSSAPPAPAPTPPISIPAPTSTPAPTVSVPAPTSTPAPTPPVSGPAPTSAPAPLPAPKSPSEQDQDSPITGVPSAAELRSAGAAAADWTTVKRPIGRQRGSSPAAPSRYVAPDGNQQPDPLGDARASLRHLLDEPGGTSSSRRTWWIVVLAAAVLIAVVVELISITGHDPAPNSAGGPGEVSSAAGSAGSVGSAAQVCPVPPTGTHGGPCLTELANLAKTGPAKFSTEAAVAPSGELMAMLQQSGPVDIVSLVGRDPATQQVLSLQLIQLKDAEQRDQLFARLGEDTSTGPQPYRQGKHPGQFVQGLSAASGNNPEMAYSLDAMPVVIVLNPVVDENAGQTVTTKSLNAAFFATVLR